MDGPDRDAMRALLEFSQSISQHQSWVGKPLGWLPLDCDLQQPAACSTVPRGPRIVRQFVARFLALVLALFLMPSLASAAACVINWNITNTGASSYTYVFTSADYLNCDPGGFGGVYLDAAGVSTGPAPIGHGSFSVDLLTPNVDKLTYAPSPTGYIGADTAQIYDGSGMGPYPVNITLTPAPPTVTSISPTSGTTAGGTSVTLTGTSFTGATAVSFGGTAAASFTVNSATSISATSPAHAAGTVDVTVTTPSGTSATSVLDQFTFAVPPPPVASVVSATVAHGSSSNPITLSLSGGTATSVAVSTAASHGTATATGTTISYTPTASYSGTDTFAYTATNAGGTSSPATATITVSAPALAISPAGGNLTGTAETAYSQTFTASAGTAPYTYSLAINSGTMPTGLSFSTSTGVLSGTPTTAGTVNFTVTATDSTTGTGPFNTSNTYALTVSSPTISVSPASLTNPTVGSAYSQTVSASGGAAAYTFVRSAGSLPTGLSLNSSTGVISGTPTAAGTFNFTVTATDANSFTGSRAYSLTVSAPTITISPTTVSAATVASAYSVTVSASGGTASYSYAITGSLPAGITMNSVTGVISGTPTAAGTFNFTVTATDSSTGTGSPFSGSRAYTLTVGAPSLAISPTSGTVLTGSVSAAFSQTFTASNGTAPYTYALTINSGTIPTGLSFSTSTGVLSGTPTSAGPVNFTVTGTDSSTGAGAPFSVSGTYTLTVSAPTIVVSPTTLPTPAIGVAYSQTVSGTGGTAPYTFAVTAGSLPTGLSLNSSTGVVSGTPTAGGAYAFTVKATDANAFNSSRAYSGTIAAATVVVAPGTLPAGQVGVAYSQTATASGGTAPYTFSISAGALPTGITLNASTGMISGTPTVASTYSFTVRAADSSTGTGAPYVGTQAYSLAISAQAAPPAPPPLIPPLNLTLTGLASSPPLLDMSGNSGPVILADLVKVLSNAVSADLHYVGQSPSGAIVLSGFNGANLAFVPISYQADDPRPNGLYPLANGQYQIVVNGVAILVAPAIQNLNQLIALLPAGTQATMAANGVLSAKIGDVTYVVQPGVIDQLPDNPSGTPSLTVGSDGYLHFTDGAGNSQTLYPAVLEPDSLLRNLLGMDATVTLHIQLDGTAAIHLLGQDWVLVPDLMLGGVAPGHLADFWWQEGPTRYRLRTLNWFDFLSQGFTVR